MGQMENTCSKRVSITNELGLHARPAAQIAEIARNAKQKIWLIKDEEQVDATSIIDILTLACFKGTEVTLRIEHKEDRSILEEIAALIETGFGE